MDSMGKAAVMRIWVSELGCRSSSSFSLSHFLTFSLSSFPLSLSHFPVFLGYIQSRKDERRLSPSNPDPEDKVLGGHQSKVESPLSKGKARTKVTRAQGSMEQGESSNRGR
ncbi:hypothetical protein LY78DRAFT_362944 [Colletotrichum sublineola]|nr:hypothetical protein LY78DRAFT_362944 [Colletotrichum sublineola]